MRPFILIIYHNQREIIIRDLRYRKESLNFATRNDIQAMGHIEDKYISLLTDFGYVRSIDAYRDIKNSVNTAMAERRKEGRMEVVKEGMDKGAKQERVDIAKRLLAINLPIEQIVATTGLSEDIVRSS